MTLNELINLPSQKVRRDSDLMAFYVSEYKKKFGKEPNCAGCTFSTDFVKLKRAVQSGTTQTPIEMKTDKTFQLVKRQGKILAYKKNGKTIRSYDNNMTDEFAVGFLTNGTKAEIEERKKLFKVLPLAILEKEQKKAEAKAKKAEGVSEDAPKKKTRKKKSAEND